MRPSFLISRCSRSPGAACSSARWAAPAPDRGAVQVQRPQDAADRSAAEASLPGDAPAIPALSAQLLYVLDLVAVGLPVDRCRREERSRRPATSCLPLPLTLFLAVFPVTLKLAVARFCVSPCRTTLIVNALDFGASVAHSCAVHSLSSSQSLLVRTSASLLLLELTTY